ncbi:c-type cytochrome [Pseudomonas asplenii]|uniref:c-type cytochrome n=1 Tax=Pseudomonas asplenii TaxID=53407 RepID=UPI003CCA91EB
MTLRVAGAAMVWLLSSGIHAAPIDSFTKDQVNHGREVFSGICSQCHGSNPAAPYAQASLRMKSIGELYTFISSKMPANNPGGLSSKDYVDVTSYLLWSAGKPSGGIELTPDLAKRSSGPLQ